MTGNRASRTGREPAPGAARKRRRQHVNPLKMTSLVPREARLALPASVPVEVELGCGDARFLLELARHRPDDLFVGLDIREAFLCDARDEVDRLELRNVMLAASNLIVDAGRLFPPGRVARFHINFPDPWFKRRHRNRRWLSAETLEDLVASLKPGGEVFFQSDVWDVALEALALLESHPGLRNRRGEWRFLRENPFPARTSRELACMDEGRDIWRMLFVRAPRAGCD